MTIIKQLEKNFKVRRGVSSSITIEENNAIAFTEKQMEEVVQHYIDEATKEELQNLHFEISSKSPNYDVYKKCFQVNHFENSGEKIVVFKDIHSIEDVENEFDLKLIEEVGEAEFQSIWHETLKGSVELKEPMLFEQFVSVLQKEMGERWKEYCLTITVNEKTIGIIIPYIERGTLEEGKLMYFGIVPSMRGKGYEATLFEKAMFVLKEIGATYYIGNADVENKWMKDVFEKTNCRQLSSTERYTKTITQG
ncbi:GNAT family N-acetyltransferase [Bacillus clarus]|uniref:GNAT family N-acetyltransferase n=1 Tax=Bacillus clarus TaxID=2338372 RepID=A0A090YN84_9BACI|nr:GNAT family N-acetyltransferase [Bacillus clarus]KFM99402.1 putative acetyltransferase [Bacillus clarus]RFT65085.1 GNAT family N-acetyltransferase [Bacillus clarus]